MEISRKRRVAGTLAFTGIAVAIFFAGAWAGSSGMLPLGPTPALASHGTNMPPDHASPGSDDSCCDMPMPAGEMGPGMHKHGGMGAGKMRPGMPMEPHKPMPKSDKTCCDKS